MIIKMNNPQKNNLVPENSGKKIDFIEIFKRAAKIVWENRFLLWFGILIALGSPGSFNISSSQNDYANNESVKSFMINHWQIILVTTILLIAIGIIIFLVSLIAKAGLILSVNAIEKNEAASFKTGWCAGKKYLGKLFRLFLVFLLTGITIVLVLATPVIYFLANHLWIWAILIGLLAIAIFIPIVFVLAFTNIFAGYYIVLSDLKVWGAIETGYNLLLKNLVNSLIFAILFLAVDVLLGIVMLPVIGIVLLVLVPAGFLFYAMSKIIFVIYLVFAIIGAAAIIFFFSAIFNTFKTTAWTLFFREIAEVKKEKTETVPEEEKIPEISVIGEKV